MYRKVEIFMHILKGNFTTNLFFETSKIGFISWIIPSKVYLLIHVDPAVTWRVSQTFCHGPSSSRVFSREFPERTRAFFAANKISWIASLQGRLRADCSLQCISWFKESKHTHRSSFANIINAVPSLQCISWFKESKHTHRSSFANIINAVPSLQCISWFKESKHTHGSSFANIINAVPSLQCISWFKESKHILIESGLPTLSMLYLL